MAIRTITGFAVGVATSAALLLAACSSSGTTTSAASGADVPGGGTTVAATGVTTRSTSLGTVATDSAGHTLYELAGDTTSSPSCTGSCLAVWPAATAGGSQIVLQGHPAFTFKGDSAAGQVRGQGISDQWGTWYALDPSGNPITAKNAPAGGASSSDDNGGSGYGY